MNEDIDVFLIGFKMEKFSTNLHVSERVRTFNHLLLSDWDFHPFHKRTCQKEISPQIWTFFLGGVLSCSFLKGSKEQKIANKFGVPPRIEIWSKFGSIAEKLWVERRSFSFGAGPIFRCYVNMHQLIYVQSCPL